MIIVHISNKMNNKYLALRILMHLVPQIDTILLINSTQKPQPKELVGVFIIIVRWSYFTLKNVPFLTLRVASHLEF